MELQDYPMAIAMLEVRLMELEEDAKPYRKQVKKYLDNAKQNAEEFNEDSFFEVKYVEVADLDCRKIKIQLTLLRSEFKVAFLATERAITSGDREPIQIESGIEELRVELEKIEASRQSIRSADDLPKKKARWHLETP